MSGRARQQQELERRLAAGGHGNDTRPAGASTGGSLLRLWLRQIRVHQWLKNLLIFVPLLASHRIGQRGAFATGLIAFFLFSWCASSAYILNDLLDLRHDRLHPYRGQRPLASGQLKVTTGLW